MALHFPNQDMMRKIITSMIRLEYADVILSPHKKRHVLKLERVRRIANNMVPKLKDLTYNERLKELQLKTLEEKRERGDLITIYNLMNILKETQRKDLVLGRKGEAGNMREHKRNCKKEFA